MRILVISNVYPPAVRGGYEVECHDVVEHLRDRHEVTVLASTWGRSRCPPEDHVLRHLPWAGDERLAESLAAPADAVRAARVTRRVLRQVQPEAIYVWNASGLPVATLMTLLRAEVPLLVRVCEYWLDTYLDHDLFARHLLPGERGARGVWARALRALDRLPSLRLRSVGPGPAAICWNSAFVRERVPAPAYLSLVHGDVVIPSNARTLRMAALVPAPVAGRILFVGRLDESKGADIVVRAVGELHRAGDRIAHAVLVGNGSSADQRALRELARSEGVTHAIRLTGPLRGAALEDEITAASAWCVPSRWDEPAPLTCTEAALAGVPGVFARVGGIPEMYADGEHALFHERDDVAGCAAALTQVLAGGPAVHARVERARLRGAELSWEPYLAAMDAFLRQGTTACLSALELLSQGPRTPASGALPGRRGRSSPPARPWSRAGP